MYTQCKGHIDVWLDDIGCHVLQVWEPTGIPKAAFDISITVQLRVDVRADAADKLVVKETLEAEVWQMFERADVYLDGPEGEDIELRIGPSSVGSEITSAGLID